MEPMCLAYGAMISLVVSALKKISLVKKYPKIVSAILSAALVGLTTILDSEPLIWQTIGFCFLTQFAAAVATHETVTHTVQDRVDTDSIP